MQVVESLLSAAPLLLILGISACGDASDANPTGGANGQGGAGQDGAPEQPVVAGMGEYVSPGASADTIMKVAREGNAEMVKLLIGETADVDFALPDGLSTLHVAVAEGHLEVAKVLLENKANPNPRQAAGATPLVAALQLKRMDLVKLLLDNRADPNIALLNGMFPLAMLDQVQWDRKDHVQLATMMADAGANLNQRIQAKGNTALMVYTATGNVDMVKWLLSRGVKINIKGDQGYTALAFAAVTNQLETARLLVEAGADLTITNNNGDTPAKIAERTKQVGVVGYLRGIEAERAQGN